MAWLLKTKLKLVYGEGVLRAKFAGKSQAMPLDSVHLDQPLEGEGRLEHVYYIYLIKCQIIWNTFLNCQKLANKQITKKTASLALNSQNLKM